MKKNILCALIGSLVTILLLGIVFHDEIKYSLFYTYVTQKYDGDFDEAKMNESIYSGIVAGLGDKHSQFISSSYLKSFNQSLSTEYDGIGVEILTSNSEPYITIASVIDGGAASSENIYPGDQIIKINDEKVTAKNAENAPEMIKSKPKVKLEIYRPSTDETITINTAGKSYTSPSVHTSIIKQGDAKNGLIKIDSFASTTGDEFKAAIEQVESKDIDKLVIDLRDNPGGELDQLEKVANEIVPGTKPYLTTKRHGKVVKEYTSTLKAKKNYPIVVLQNENTASAAEILSAALKEINGSAVIGTTSYGKGSVQRIFNLDNIGAAMKITIEHWFTPDGEQIDNKGIKPTIELKDTSINVEPIILTNKLKLGSKEQNVLLVKQYLKMIGYEQKVDSIEYDEQTKSNIEQFQKENNLKENGIVDIKTAKILYEQAASVRYHPSNDNIIKRTFK